jgi:hypothetical protein
LSVTLPQPPTYDGVPTGMHNRLNVVFSGIAA